MKKEMKAIKEWLEDGTKQVPLVLNEINAKHVIEPHKINQTFCNFMNSREFASLDEVWYALSKDELSWQGKALFNSNCDVLFFAKEWDAVGLNDQLFVFNVKDKLEEK